MSRQSSAVSTTSLTDSFGAGYNVHQQHDVSELNRILIDAIDRSLKGTSEEQLIPSVFRGQMVNETLCKECRNLSQRFESFYDLTLTVEGSKNLGMPWHSPLMTKKSLFLMLHLLFPLYIHLSMRCFIRKVVESNGQNLYNQLGGLLLLGLPSFECLHRF